MGKESDLQSSLRGGGSVEATPMNEERRVLKTSLRSTVTFGWKGRICHQNRREGMSRQVGGKQIYVGAQAKRRETFKGEKEK